VKQQTAILVIDNYDSFTYNLVQLIRKAGIEPAVRKIDEMDVGFAAGFSHIMLSPGPGLPADFPLMKEVILCYGPTTHILGVCLGHQAIAEAYGAKLLNMERVFHGLSTSVSIATPVDPLFDKMQDGFKAGLYHSWAVEAASLPSCLMITAFSDEEIVMGISHKEYSVKGIQFHPESVMTPTGLQIIRNWLNN
jgi:anthranilate synthase component 2